MCILAPQNVLAQHMVSVVSDNVERGNPTDATQPRARGYERKGVPRRVLPGSNVTTWKKYAWCACPFPKRTRAQHMVSVVSDNIAQTCAADATQPLQREYCNGRTMTLAV